MKNRELKEWRILQRWLKLQKRHKTKQTEGGWQRYSAKWVA